LGRAAVIALAREDLAQLLRYATVGAAANLALYLAYLGLTAQGLGSKVAMSLLYFLAVTITFVANRSWSFRHKGTASGALGRYAAAYALGYVMNYFLLWLGVDVLGLPHQGVQAFAIVAVAVALFVLNKYWVFSPKVTGEQA
jgi:putative flippase GtrA